MGLKAKGNDGLAGLKKYVEWMTLGRKTGRVAFVLTEDNLPEPAAGAEWAVVNSSNAAEEVLRDPSLEDVFRAATDKAKK